MAMSGTSCDLCKVVTGVLHAVVIKRVGGAEKRYLACETCTNLAENIIKRLEQI